MLNFKVSTCPCYCQINNFYILLLLKNNFYYQIQKLSELSAKTLKVELKKYLKFNHTCTMLSSISSLCMNGFNIFKI